MDKIVVKGTGLETPCQVWQGPEGRKFVVANFQYYDDAFDDVDCYDFIVEGITPSGELIDAGIDDLENLAGKVIDFGRISELILRGWGYLFPTLEVE